MPILHSIRQLVIILAICFVSFISDPNHIIYEHTSCWAQFRRHFAPYTKTPIRIARKKRYDRSQDIIPCDIRIVDITIPF